MSGKNMMSYLKMATVQEKAMCVLWFFELSPLSNLSVDTELNMEKIHLQLMLSDVAKANAVEHLEGN
jgi:hypothetical protein